MLGELLQMFNPLCRLILVPIFILLSLPIEMLLIGFSHATPPLRHSSHDLAERQGWKLLHDGELAFFDENHIASQRFLRWSTIIDRPLGLHILVVLYATDYLLFNFLLLLDFNVFLLFFPFFSQELAYFLLILTKCRVNLHQLSKSSLAEFSVFGCQLRRGFR
jgi:hypothetical protein